MLHGACWHLSSLPAVTWAFVNLPSWKLPVSLALTLSFQSLKLWKLSCPGSSSNPYKNKAKYVITCIFSNSLSFLCSWMTYIMLQHGDGKARGGSQRDRGAQLLTFLFCKVNSILLCRLKKKRQNFASYFVGFWEKKLHYWILWEYNHPHGNRALSMMVISLFHQKDTYGFYFYFFGRENDRCFF